MDKRQFVEHVIDQVRSLSVSHVVEDRITLTQKYGNHMGYCPFHNDTKLGSFVVTDRKGIWKCFSCGVGGDTVKFISLYDSINYLEAAFKLGLRFGIISSWEYDEYYANRRYKKDEIEKIQRRYEELDKDKMQNNIADDATLDKVFRIFIESCDLNEEHKQYLIQERQLSEERIEKGLYFTFPTRNILKSFMQKIGEEFGNEEVLLQIPGFYKEDNKKAGKKLFTFAKHKGIGIGIQNAKGQVVGIQIRHDVKVEDRPRYVWFSSSFAQDHEKYEGGTGAGAPVDIVFPDVVKNTTVFITEGRFKAEHISKSTGSIAVSVQGVNSWRGIIKALEEIPSSPKLAKRKDYHIYCVLVAFDADMNYNYAVAEQLRKMTDQLVLKEYDVYYLNWNEQFGKGIDDVLISGGKDEIKRYDKDVWDVLHKKMIETLLKQEGYENMSKVPAEVLREYFETYLMKKIKPLSKNEPGQRQKEKLKLQLKCS